MLPTMAPEKRPAKYFLIAAIVITVAYVGIYAAVRATGSIRIEDNYWPDAGIHSRVKFENDSQLLRTTFWPLWMAESTLQPAAPMIAQKF